MSPVRRIALSALLFVSCSSSAPALGAPTTWTQAPVTSLPSLAWWQGMASDAQGRLYFDGISTGLYRADTALEQTAGLDPAIGSDAASVGYNHIGDIAWDAAEGGRVLLPFECYSPGAPGGPNTCGSGAIGVNDPETMAPRYYVALNTGPIQKAMWVAVSSDGTELYTSSGKNLLVYAAADVKAANAAPAGPAILPVRTYTNVLPTSGITGGAVFDGRLYLATGDNRTAGGDPLKLYSIDPSTGTGMTLELAPDGIKGESEGLDTIGAFDGVLHWMVSPRQLINLRPADGPDAALTLSRTAGGDLGVAPAWSVSVRNAGTTTTTSPLRVDLASNIPGVSASGDGWSCVAAVACAAAAPLAPGATAPPLTLSAPAPTFGSYLLRAAVATPGDYAQSDDGGSDGFTLVAPPAVTLTVPSPTPATNPQGGSTTPSKRTPKARSTVVRIRASRLALRLLGADPVKRSAKTTSIRLVVSGHRLALRRISWSLDGHLRSGASATLTLRTAALTRGLHRVRATVRVPGVRTARTIDLRFWVV